jgi:iron complex outermembrane receptor protein
MNSRAWTVLALCLCLGAPSLTLARDAQEEQEGQEGSAAEETPRFESEVHVEAEPHAAPPPSTAATRLPVAVRDLPVSVTIVPERIVQEQSANVVGDALKNVSGVNVATGFGVFDFFVIRGFDSLNGGLVLTDGIPEPESTFYPLYNVDQVEVLKGPSSFLYGGNPLSGAVQLVRRRPASDTFADVTLGYGRFGTYEATLDGNAATSDGALAFRLNATTEGTDQYRDLPEGTLNAVNPTLSWRPDDRTRLGLDFEYVESRFPPDTGIPFLGQGDPVLAPVPRTTSYQSPFDGSTQKVSRFRVLAERELGEGLTLRNRLYFTQLDWESNGTLLVGAFPGADGRMQVQRTLTLLDDVQKLLGNQLELSAAFGTGSVHHDLLVGLELQRLTDGFTQDVGLLPPIDLLEPVETAQPPIVTLPPFAQAGDSRSLVVAPYLIDRLRFSPKWQAFVGARLDALDYEDPPNDTERDSTRVNPLLGVVYSPTNALGLHASWGTASAPPSTQVVGPRNPEESWQVELGAKLAFLDGRGFAGLALYDLRRENIGIPDSTGITRQDGDQRSRGIELDASVEPFRGWSLQGAYAYTDSELTRFSEIVQLQPPDFVVVDHSGNTAPFAPRHLFSLWVSKRFDLGLGLAVGLRHVSDQLIAPDNRATIEAYTTLAATVSYTRDRWGLQVHLRNLTDTEYETRGFGSASAIPGRPLEVRARLRVGFGKR